MVYFPDEVFRNIVSYLTDPYKAEKEKHALVWQRIRVKRERFTGPFETEDEYFVYTRDDIAGSPDWCITTIFCKDDHLQELDNVHEYIEYEDGEYGEDEWHNYAFEQYE